MSHLSMRKAFRERFRPFVGEPWFKSTEESFFCAWEDDDEYSEYRIQDGLLETAKRRSIELPPARCGDCENPKADIRYVFESCAECRGEQCRNGCLDVMDTALRELRREAKLAAMTEPEREEHLERERQTIAYMFDGLFSRTVQ